MLRHRQPRRVGATPDHRAAMIDILEPKQMLSGNVEATIDENGHLKLLGDSGDNDLTVGINADGTVSFTSTGTTVNGQAANAVNLAGVVNSISVAMDGGNDELVIQAGEHPNLMPHLSGGISVRMGAGDDLVAVRGLDIAGRVYLSGGDGADRVLFESANAHGDVIVAGNRGDDTVAVRFADIGGDLFLRGGGEDDTTVTGTFLTVDGETRINGGGGELVEVNPLNTDDVTAHFEIDGSPAPTDMVIAWYVNGSANGIFDGVTMEDGFPAVDIAQFQSTDSGLFYRIIDAGDATRPTVDDNVTVDYQGLNLDGTQFDSSYARDTPATFDLANLIEGWQQGIPLIGQGGRIQLLIPSDLAYGSQGAGSSIRPFATLLFNIELHSVN